MLPRFVPPPVLRRVPRALAGLLVCLSVLLTGCSSHPGTVASSGVSTPSWAGGMATVEESRLPAEARQTLALIGKGGPFPYARDGVVFSNFERLLPKRRRGYYHEYTVRTPGSQDRGARRIVTGQGGEIYYSDDHYKSFRAVLR
ncbi:ribonuclease T1 [Streptomyces griseochromogenes]|uniref:Ribonuclease N n=1 Tax=Streptomyces griseochromogenes TaxID=68214 RepID=A0A1B1B4X6_9ACTN|nr:ribonuclease domain-containing protein [Streptomyces griseochromogenes]ANP53873.1 ribonuclease N [Streptomyces griseochromogenes]MBP2053677.1 ribonuclease T1 [Streptomyces griseochromogenes]